VPWLRLDDGFTNHPKILALKTPARRWAFLEILAYTSRYRSAHVPDEIRQVIPSATQAFLDELEHLGLLERDTAGQRRVHDWEVYNGATTDTRVTAYLLQNPDANTNDVHRHVGGRKQTVLEAITRYRNGSHPDPQEDTTIY
jgi:hypothetical protein